MRRCDKCKEQKPPTDFYKSSRRSDGLQTRCKSCQHRDSADRAKKNPEKHAQYVAKWQAKNKDKVLAAVRRWQANHPERVRENIRQWCERDCRDLGDLYVKKLIAASVGCKPAEVPKELVQAKRHHLSLKRLLEEKE